MKWHFLRRDRQRTQSRPRVARAAQAARSVQIETGLLGTQSAVGGLAAAVGLPVVPATLATTQPVSLGSAELAASPALLLAVARASNRSVEEVWEEALARWLREEESAPQTRRPTQANQRRLDVWHEIDSTLLALRAG